MNKRMIILRKNLLCTLLIGLFSFSASANLGKILDTQEDGRITINHDCEFTLTFTLNITNFDLNVPIDIPQMFFSYQVADAPTQYVPVYPDQFVYYGQMISSKEVYEWRHPVTFNADQLYQGNIPPAINYTLGLVATNSSTISGYHDYPIYFFTDPGSFFSCQVFDVSFGQQNPILPCYIPFPYPYTTHEDGFLEAQQNYCGLLNDFDSSNPNLQAPPSKEAQEREIQAEQIDRFNAFSFTPNPFDNELVVPMEIAQDTEFDLIVFDAAGKIVDQQNQFLQKGMHQLYLDTHHWPQGLYYAQVKTNAGLQTHRLVKTNIH